MRSTTYKSALLFALLVNVIAYPVSHNEHHQHLDENEGDKSDNTDSTTPSTTTSQLIVSSTAAIENSSDAQQIPGDIAANKSPTFVYDYDPADYPADTTGTLLDSNSQVMSWGPEAEMFDYQEDDYSVYPDEPSVDEKGESERDYFTDLEDYSEEGPSFQKLILLAAARHRHRAYRVPPGDVTIVLRGS